MLVKSPTLPPCGRLVWVSPTRFQRFTVVELLTYSTSLFLRFPKSLPWQSKKLVDLVAWRFSVVVPMPRTTWWRRSKPPAGVRWSAVEELKKSAPALKWKRWVDTGGTFVAMRVDTKPFDDIRVRRALNMAVNKQEIVTSFYGGNAEVFAYPQHPDYVGYFEPLSAMPTT